MRSAFLIGLLLLISAASPQAQGQQPGAKSGTLADRLASAKYVSLSNVFTNPVLEVRVITEEEYRDASQKVRDANDAADKSREISQQLQDSGPAEVDKQKRLHEELSELRQLQRPRSRFTPYKVIAAYGDYMELGSEENESMLLIPYHQIARVHITKAKLPDGTALTR